MSTPVAGVVYSYDSNARRWVAPGREPLPYSTSRDDLVYGEYVPGPTTAGLVRPDATFKEVRQVSLANNYNNVNLAWLESQGIPVIDALVPDLQGVPRMRRVARIVDYEFWGRTRPQRPSAGDDDYEIVYEFYNCIFHGPDPEGIDNQQGCIQNYGSNPPLIRIFDSLIDPGAWPNFGMGRGGWGNNWIGGIHGGNYEVHRTEIVNVQDGIDILGPTGSTAAAYAARHWTFGCHIHKGAFFNPPWTDPGAPSDQQPHGDGIQTSHGKNIKIIGNLIGGTRVPSDYAPWPIAFTQDRPGDDFWNAGLMLKQEVNDSDIYRIENVEIAYNVIGGGTATINHAYGSSRPSAFMPSTLGTTSVHHNRVLTRGSDWGNLGPFGQGTADDAGWHILRSANFASMYWDNTMFETGAPVPISNG